MEENSHNCIDLKGDDNIEINYRSDIDHKNSLSNNEHDNYNTQMAYNTRDPDNTNLPSLCVDDTMDLGNNYDQEMYVLPSNFEIIVDKNSMNNKEENDNNTKKVSPCCRTCLLITMLAIWVFILAYIVVSIVGICSVFVDHTYLGKDMTWRSAVPQFIIGPIILLAAGIFMTVCASKAAKENKDQKNGIFTETTTIIDESRIR